MKKFVIDTDNNTIVSMEIQTVFKNDNKKEYLDEYGTHIHNNLVFSNFNEAVEALLSSLDEEYIDHMNRAKRVFEDIKAVCALREENI